MNEYYFNVYFEKGKIQTDLKKLVQNDYNSTKINFTFDKEGRVLFKMLYPDGETIYVTEIQDNELVFGPGILSQEGDYEIEVSLYSGDGKLTDYATKTFYVRNEVVDTDDIVVPEEKVAIIDQLINDVTELEATVTTNETTRNSNEGTRQSNEQTRTSNETTRVSNENTRIANETARENYINNLQQAVERGDFDGEDGYTPVKGEDYYTEEEKEELVDEVTGDATTIFNQNVTEKTTEFNTNASNKTTDFNTNASNKTTAYDNNHTAKLEAYDTNATNKLSDYNTNASGKLSDYNTNATNKTDAYNSNHTTKLEAYNDNASDKTSTFNSNATSKTTDFNTNASDKTTAFNENYQEKLDDFNDNAESYEKRLTRAEMVYNTIPKVSASGTSLTLDDTAECPMELELSPSEISQDTTTGKNLLPYPYTDTTKTANGITFTDNGDGSITINGTATSSASFYLLGTSAGSVVPNSLKTNLTVAGLGVVVQGSFNDASGDFYGSGLKNTNLTNVETGYIRIFITSGTTINNVTVKPYIVSGTYTNETIPDYEPYTGGQASPNPSYPQDIHVVSGDNEIKVQNKNLFDGNYVNGFIGGSSGYRFDTDSATRIAIVKVKPNTTYSIKKYQNTGLGNRFLVAEYPTLLTSRTEMGVSSRLFYNNDVIETVITTSSIGNYLYVYVTSDTNSIPYLQIEKSTQATSQATSYVPHQEQVLPLNLGVKNLFDIQSIEKGRLDNGVIGYTDDTYDLIKSNDYFSFKTYANYRGVVSDYIEVKPTTDYIYSQVTSLANYSIGVSCYDESKNYIGSATRTDIDNYSRKYTTLASTKYLRINIQLSNTGSTTIEKPQLEKGSTAHSYSPFGQAPIEYCRIGNYKDKFFKNVVGSEDYDSTLELNKWYLKKNIGKYIFTGNESLRKSNVTTIDRFIFDTNLIASGMVGMSNYFTYMATETIQVGKMMFYAGTQVIFYFSEYGTTTLEDFKSWLADKYSSDKPVIIWYQLATPTYTLLNETLQTQLDNIYNWVTSYKDQTNITQTNNDLPFEISASACKDLQTMFDEITNAIIEIGGGE